MTREYQAYFDVIEQRLKVIIPEESFDFMPDQRPLLLSKAMNYSLLAGGKRIRPVMLLAAYNLLKEDLERAIPFAVALEMIHTYSLIHDDLPAMDNDDYRRGKLTNHKVFGEANGILAGDGLLNLAYEQLLMACGAMPSPFCGMKAAEIIAFRAGGQGMIGGQVADMMQEGCEGDEKILQYIQRHKTAALFMASMEAGICLGDANEEQKGAAKEFGYHYGMAFQMIDDWLDVVGDATLLGKSIGKDAKQQKLTWPSLIGIENTKLRAEEHVQLAIEQMKGFGTKGKFFIDLAQSTLKRVQ